MSIPTNDLGTTYAGQPCSPSQASQSPESTETVYGPGFKLRSQVFINTGTHDSRDNSSNCYGRDDPRLLSPQ
eukprot:g16978.t1